MQGKGSQRRRTENAPPRGRPAMDACVPSRRRLRRCCTRGCNRNVLELKRLGLTIRKRRRRTAARCTARATTRCTARATPSGMVQCEEGSSEDGRRHVTGCGPEITLPGGVHYSNGNDAASTLWICKRHCRPRRRARHRPWSRGEAAQKVRDVRAGHFQALRQCPPCAHRCGCSARKRSTSRSSPWTSCRPKVGCTGI